MVKLLYTNYYNYGHFNKLNFPMVTTYKYKFNVIVFLSFHMCNILLIESTDFGTGS